MKPKELKPFIELMKKEHLVELTAAGKDFYIKLRREGEIFRSFLPEDSTVVELSEEKKEEDNLIKVTSPLVGIFYSASSPTSPPFVEEEKDVEVGETLCIIESMKVMNEIKSEVKGEVKKILVENGQPVEYGQELFLIKQKT